MSLHTDWSAAKKDSIAKFKLAKKARRDAEEKKIKAGDAKAKAKQLDDTMKLAGLGQGVEDVDAYFRFKEDLGPNLDKLEKAALAKAAVRQREAQIRSITDVLNDAKLSAVLGKCAKSMGVDDFYAFVTAGWKADPAKAMPVFIARGAPMEINIDARFIDPLRQLASNPQQLKAQGPALLAACRTEFISVVGSDVLRKLQARPEYKAAMGSVDLSALKTKVQDAVASYRQQIKAQQPKWKGIAPDFCTPLLNALDAIDAQVTPL